jgi:hypothetical protein
LVALSLGCVLVACAARAGGAAGYVYWTNYSDGTIGRANLDGSGVDQSFIAGARSPGAVAVDGAHVYWTNFDTVSIGRANLDGSGVNQDFIAGVEDGYGVAVDGAHIYWTGFNSDAIGRANLDGSDVNPYFINSVAAASSFPTGVAVDSAHIYWASRADKIEAAYLYVSLVNQNFITGARNPDGVAVDGAYVYWANSDTGTIGRASLDGSDADQTFITGARIPDGVAVDGAHIYWANGAIGTIGRANLDGSDVDQSFIPSASNAYGVAVDALPRPLAPPPALVVAASPQISSARLSSAVFRAADRGASLSAERKQNRKTGTDVHYRDSQTATTAFRVLKRSVGRREGKRCVRGRPHSHRKRCARLISLGSSRHKDQAGDVKVHFTGRMRARKLRRGRYLLALTPRANGKAGRTIRLSFRIIE